MPSKRSDIVFLFDVLIAIFTIKKYSHDILSVDDLIDNEPLCFIAKANLEIIGEAINHLLKRSELSEYLPDLNAKRREDVVFYLNNLLLI